ncbi:DUF2304 domain-containing protein [Nocardioides currus]|uniref:DUF2304 domain-containing protein n=1 Tax=Nocardioides currus TaxID=2133958 RepID=A0A2R7YY33_9ACTN|nr:DUF2304 domain-containing protein [Nocardioides currus]PUA80906.1 DUF2304 domain-containing protein [Nocardioides currus]
MTPTALGVAVSVIVTVVLFEMLRRHRLREKYALIWFSIAIGLLVITIFPVVLTSAAELLHVQVPANLLFFVGSLLLLAMSLQHSFELGRLEERTRTLAEEVALLRLALDERAPDQHGVDERGLEPPDDLPEPGEPAGTDTSDDGPA